MVHSSTHNSHLTYAFACRDTGSNHWLVVYSETSSSNPLSFYLAMNAVTVSVNRPHRQHHIRTFAIRLSVTMPSPTAMTISAHGMVMVMMLMKLGLFAVPSNLRSFGRGELALPSMRMSVILLRHQSDIRTLTPAPLGTNFWTPHLVQPPDFEFESFIILFSP